MPGQQQTPRRPERVALRQGLLAAHVDHRAGQVPFFERLDQIGVHHRHAASDVDKQPGGLELLEQRRVVQVMGIRRVGQQVDHVIHLPHQPAQLVEPRHFDKRCLLAGLAGDAIQLHAERQQKLGHALADVTGADDQRLTPRQALAHAVIPFALHLADQPRQHFALVAQHVGEDKLGHDLAKNAYRAGQPVVAWQAIGQQGRDARPGRLQPLRMMALAQQGSQQIGLAQPHRTVGGQAREFGRVAAGQHFEVWGGVPEQLGVERMILFSNQNTHGSNL